MRRVVILHGRPDESRYFDESVPAPSNSHWLPWLQNQLLVRGYDAQTPQVVNAHLLDYQLWSSELDRHTVADPATFVGYSCGGGVMLRWLSEHPHIAIDKLVLVAPWLDVDRREETAEFFDFSLDSDLMRRARETHLFYSLDDNEDIQPTIDLVRNTFPDTIYHEYDGLQHFRSSEMGTDEFPDLRDAIIS